MKRILNNILLACISGAFGILAYEDIYSEISITVGIAALIAIGLCNYTPKEKKKDDN